MSALEAARAMARGVKRVLPQARLSLLPISDGGDGLMETLLASAGGRRFFSVVRGPLGRPLRAPFAVLRDGTAIVEMAQASGLARVPQGRRDALRATSFGTGELIRAAIKKGAKTVVVGLGGSATNDGGAGMAQALGVRLLDASGRDLPPGAAALLKLARIDWGRLPLLVRGVRFLGISDVNNPLLGAKGSARVFGPQKGATAAQVGLIEKALRRYAGRLKRDLKRDVADRPGAGAAGGLGAGLMAFLGAELVGGADWVLDELEAGHLLQGADAALTGEGRLDRTSFFGKAPVEFARRAKALGVPVAAVCGSFDEAVAPRLKAAGIKAVVSFAEAGATDATSYRQAARWAEGAAALAVKRLLLAAACLGVLAAPAFCQSLEKVDGLYLHRHQGSNLEESSAQLEAMLAKDPNDAAALWRLGRNETRLGERRTSKKERLAFFEKAQVHLKKAVALKPGNAEAHFFLGMAMGRYGQTRGIMKSLFILGPMRKEMAAVLKINPKHGGAHHVLGEMALQVPRLAGGSKKEAVEHLELAAGLEPNRSVHYLALAKAYLAVGDKDKAKTALLRIQAIKTPEDPAEHEEVFTKAAKQLERLR